MTKLEKMKKIVSDYPGADILKDFRIDYTDQIPATAGLFPAGLIELRRRQDILGNIEIENRLNFALYLILPKSGDDDVLNTINAEWIINFQEYIQDLNFTKNFPPFGDYHNSETISATDGRLYDSTDEGLGLYAIQISVQYQKRYTKD